MDFWIKAGQLLFSLSIIVVLHELGHFIPAKLFKTRVEKFYLFFDPWFSLFKVKRGETEYGIGWIPLGGYVKISGMVDESMDREQMEKEPEPYEFRSKPAWQRLIIMVGGVTVNIILGMAIYMMILFVYGKQMLPTENARYGVYADSTLVEQGIHYGDKIKTIGGEYPEYFNNIDSKILIEGARSITVERNGKDTTVTLPKDFDQTLLANNVRQLFAPRVPFIIDSVIPGKPAANAGLKKGDSIFGVNGQKDVFALEFAKTVRSHKGEEVTVHFYRDGYPDSAQVGVTDKGIIGVANRSPVKSLKFVKKKYGFFESIPAGVTHGWNTLSGYVESLSLLFTEEGAKQIGGFGTIGKMFPDQWDWHRFWNLTALLSIILAFMNILPIPALDGGHVMFLLYEMISGRPPGRKFLEHAQMVGMIVLLALLLYANGNDLFKWLSG